MKQVFFSLLFFALLPGMGLGQVVDTTGLAWQVDSLIQISRTFTAKGDFDKALEINNIGEELVLKKPGRQTALYGNLCSNHGRVLYFKKDYPGAEKWYLEAKNIREKVLGKEDLDYAWSLSSLASLYWRMGENDKVEPLYLEIKDIREKALGKEHPDYVTNLTNLATFYRHLGDYEKEKPLCLEALSIREKILGKTHPDYAWSLNDVGTVYMNLGDYEKAERYYIEAITIREKILGKDDPEYAGTVCNLALLYYNMGEFDKSEMLYLTVKSIREKVLGKEHPDYVVVLSNLANLYIDMGYYEKAELLHLEAKNIRGKVLGKEDPDYAVSLIGLGNLYSAMGNYERSESYQLEANAIIEKKLGKGHPFYADCLNNLANLYQDMGNYEEAELLQLESKSIREKIFGHEHPDYAISLNNLANLYGITGNFEKGEPLLLEAKAIREKVLGKEHPDYAETLNSLGNIYGNIGDYKNAELFYLESKAIQEKTLGKEHIGYAASLNSLADLYVSMDNYEKAELLLLEAKYVFEIKLNNLEHPIYMEGLKILANLFEKENRFTEAEPLFFDYYKLSQSKLSQSASFLSERELSKYAATFRVFGNDLLYKLSSRITKSKQIGNLPALCYSYTLFHKGFLLIAANHINNLVSSSAISEDINSQLKDYRRRLAVEYTKPIAERKNIAELEEKANTLEKKLTREVAGFGDAIRQVSWQEVQAALKPAEASVEFVHYKSSSNHTDSTLYAALVLRPGWSAPRMVPLFEQRVLQPLLSGANIAATAGQLYASRGVRRDEGIVIPASKTGGLYSLIWVPLDSLLRGATTVYYAPSGLLHRLDLAAIAVPGTDQILADKYSLVQLGSTRQLVVREQPTTSAQSATLFGGIKYELEKPTESADSVAQTKPSYDVAALRSALGGRGGDTWNYLPGTEKEVKNVAATLGKAGYSVRTLSGHEGSEAAFKMMGKTGQPAPRVLHIATHGFFFPDPKDTTRQREIFSDREPVFKTSDNPLLRSGLVLAGANPAWAGGKTPEGQEDGILTAYEISQMNLSGTELVVLSACETGLGDVEDSEGVYGLKRAFKIAGAKYLIMSLWQVPDQQTQELMSAFYKNWLERKMPIPKAFSAAQQTMRKRYSDPFFWAGFVLVE